MPLFVEELTKMVLESGLLTATPEGWALAGPLPPLAIPATLHDSLLARLDRLAPAKLVAQVGAAIGRSFGHKLLAAVAGLPAEELDRALDDLTAAELVFPHGAPPDASYTFKHALVQDTAYQSLLKSRREQLHQRIAAELEAGGVGEQAPSSRTTTPGRRSKQPPDPVRPQGRTPETGLTFILSTPATRDMIESRSIRTVALR